MTTARVYIEVGKSKCFASSVDWPGWSRSAKTEDAAIETLLEFGPRYAAVLKGKVTGFTTPKSVVVAERVKGDVGTDYGVPGQQYPGETKRITGKELERQIAALQACWAYLIKVARKHAGVELRKGPRGGGRDFDGVVEHVLNADVAYVSSLGGKVKPSGDDPLVDLPKVHKAFIDTLRGRLDGSVPAVGPRGGERWPIRYGLRYVAWHSLDHAWEIEDRRVD